LRAARRAAILARMSRLLPLSCAAVMHPMHAVAVFMELNL
jgi:hypothetical protein